MGTIISLIILAALAGFVAGLILGIKAANLLDVGG
jgi:hypothetical protein